MDTVTSGEITVKGEKISNYNENQLTDYRAENIGFIFQFYNILPTLTVLENVQLINDIVKEPKDAKEILKEVSFDYIVASPLVRAYNTAQIVMEAEGVPTMKMQAHSIGGGRIKVCKLDGIDVNFSGETCTLIIRNIDEPGRIMDVSAALSKAEINIATMQVFRDKRGGCAVMVVETDQVIPKEAIEDLESKPGIIRVKFLDPNGVE